MKVKAKRIGYYAGKRQNKGAIFFLKDKEHFSKNWMEEVVSQPQPAKKKASKKKSSVSKEAAEKASTKKADLDVI